MFILCSSNKDQKKIDATSEKERRKKRAKWFEGADRGEVETIVHSAHAI